MLNRSHIDLNKLNKVPSNHPFEYRDVVSEDFPKESHGIDGRRFKSEVEHGKYENVAIYRESDDRVQYKKL
ncbi:hypothetical protein [Tepidibacter hydrothermalis]|uniref:Uncharacterized protein n=1 Tax=Tepidibacter hydrothermalis TaxID=3036126 RepID=A0ABY8EER4_9FIRM|nr:hypothetical protein [Tepidibacter hydrothermalis]WFD11433.1 hypothetical protein P4S50_04985 [Tepidibacter hydrothermalis]